MEGIKTVLCFQDFFMPHYGDSQLIVKKKQNKTKKKKNTKPVIGMNRVRLAHTLYSIVFIARTSFTLKTLPKKEFSLKTKGI